MSRSGPIWTGIGGLGGPFGSKAKALASSQSVLGLGGDALVLAGMLALGLPAVVRIARGRAADTEQRGPRRGDGLLRGLVGRLPRHDLALSAARRRPSRHNGADGMSRGLTRFRRDERVPSEVRRSTDELRWIDRSWIYASLGTGD
jgi:hypothetical protein